jgi:hypothetical protein
MKSEKQCPRCGHIKHISEFVTIYGYPNIRGKYCFPCFNDREREYATEILEGRDFCLYCGKKIEKLYDWSPDGNPCKTYVNLDHMDPISLGGEDTDENTVYCCPDCNLKKGGKTFTDWLKNLESPYREIAREVYTKKQGRQPEDFQPKKLEIIMKLEIPEVLKL